MKKLRLVDGIVMLETMYIFICAVLGAMGRLYELPVLIKYAMIIFSIIGIIFIWYKYRSKEYSNKGMLFMITTLPIMWNILLVLHK